MKLNPIHRCLAFSLVVLVAASCRDASSRPDSGSLAGSGGGADQTGSGGAAMGGGGGPSGLGGAATGGAAGAMTAGSGGTAAGGAGGTAAGGSGGAAAGDAGGAAGASEIDAGPISTDGPADTGGALEPIRVSGGTRDAETYNDVRFIGVGLEQWEGAVVTFRVGSETGVWRLGSGQVRIAGGGFDVLLPDVNPPTYQLKLAHIDADGNGACDVGEPAFADQSLRSTDYTLTVTPSDLRFRMTSSYWCGAVNDWPIP